MFLIQWSRNGSLRVYHFKWTPGKTIGRIPKLLHPAALLVWNALTLLTYLRDRLLGPSAIGFHDSEINENLVYGVKYAYDCEVDGDIAEFGTMSGTTAAVMARAMRDYQRMHGHNGFYKPKKLFLFDSFQGLPKVESEIDARSPLVELGVWREGACKVLGPVELRGACEKFLPADRISIHEGWFKDTLSKLPSGAKFAVMHLDCDLYQSAKDVLDYCFSRGLVQEGTAIYFDDWNCNKASPRFGERKAWAETVEKYAVDYSDGREYGWTGKRFIVHSYQRSPS